MTPSHCSSAADGRPGPSRHDRATVARARSSFCDPDDPPASQRAYARQSGVPRSTLGDWMRDPGPADLPPALVAFFRSPVGEAFLRRLVHAALLAFRHHGPCGLRSVSLFLELARLDRFVASSYGALHSLDAQLQADLLTFRDQEQPRLVEQMPHKSITVVPDENFHGDRVCLVAIEPVSNFILVERHADRRDGDTWAAAVRSAVEGWPVTVVQLTSDQSSGLIRCAADCLRVHHSPDLLHLQRDLFKPLLLPLQRPINEARKELDKAAEKAAHWEQKHHACQAGDAAAGRADPFEALVEQVREQLRAGQRIEQAQARVERVVQAVRGIGDDYRPFDHRTGEPVTAQQVAGRLEAHLSAVEREVAAAGLGQRAAQGLDKAHGWVGVLVACVAWFWTVVGKRVEELELSEEAERQVRGCLIAGCYWEAAAGKARDAEEKHRLAEMGRRLQREAWAEGGALAALDQQQKGQVWEVARECAGLFQRSSSCVEGRNGRLSLFHHGQGKLSDQRLHSLTVVHNYLVRRADGTTAAERLFGARPPDLFDWLLQHMPDLPRPAAKRPKKPSHAAPEAA
jgi:hypothetical protein